ncbi:4-hydroxy-tetrahydrodipicolinate reductase [Terrilactibacillus laevilacticus]|uniref:4-hydroxy-tetrahydrodipicolinate reductase n=1 Tax=Terrilactibacillus laevilacticus TaxID=1380157 RepID=A0ABW5PP41_9BACI|nr:4-hydroxy-tetrahydrodipicolinate reductase [Terrilactibacillus laevilacticus]
MSQEKIKLIVAGARGRMGSETVKMISRTPDFELVGVVDHKYEGEKIGDLLNLSSMDARVYTDIEHCFSDVKPDVLIDFTHPEIGKKHLQTAIDYGIKTVIGTSGFTSEEVERFKKQMDEKQLGGIIAPNFAIGAVLLMKFSSMAAKYFPDVEIIEMHHDQKKDAPSGTAVKTAELIQKNREQKAQGHPEEKELLPGARGAEFDGLRIHSVRLPGLIAHQEVLLGGDGELLTLRHDSMNRQSFMTGVAYSVRTVMSLNTLVYGLENILD